MPTRIRQGVTDDGNHGRPMVVGGYENTDGIIKVPLVPLPLLGVVTQFSMPMLPASSKTAASTP